MQLQKSARCRSDAVSSRAGSQQSHDPSNGDIFFSRHAGPHTHAHTRARLFCVKSCERKATIDPVGKPEVSRVQPRTKSLLFILLCREKHESARKPKSEKSRWEKGEELRGESVLINPVHVEDRTHLLIFLPGGRSGDHSFLHGHRRKLGYKVGRRQRDDEKKTNEKRKCMLRE